mmetsp:Transcript_38253/g.63273  ORF Transcript_38253/g.63273 Transcript_38253/m.63273 type:complete len:186 (+) Transcript_38253:281-838(+)
MASYIPSKKKGDFVEFWRDWLDQWKRDEDYRKARGIPEPRYCPRCDNLLKLVRRVPSNFTYEEVHAKRQIYRKRTVSVTRDHTDKAIDGAGDKDAHDDISAGNFEDRYCCPNDSCFINECSIEFSHNTVQVRVLEGIVSERRWKKHKKKLLADTLPIETPSKKHKKKPLAEKLPKATRPIQESIN